MKLHDRVYDADPSKLGTVVATSAPDDADVYEDEFVKVKWDDKPDTETHRVECLDRVAC